MLSTKGSVKITICILILLGVSVLVGFYLLLRTQQEKTNALLMQTMLINTAIAEELYYDKQGSFTTQWSELLPTIARPTSSSVELTEVPENPYAYYISFGKGNQYKVYLKNSVDKKLFIEANRMNSGLFDYQLQYSLPDPQVQCKGGWATRWFCDYMLKQIDNLDVKNLIRVPSENKSTDRVDK